MIKKYKNIIIVVILGLIISTPIFALEVNYPTLPDPTHPGVSLSLTNFASLVQYVYYVYIFALVIAGIIGVFSLVVAGITILVRGGNPEAIGAARERAFGSILGIILLMCSYLILRTINPDLLSPKNPSLSLEGTYGVYYMATNASGENTYLQVPDAESNTNTIPESYTKIFYWCPSTFRTPKLLIWAYNKINFETDVANNGSNSVNTFSLTCGPIPGDSNTLTIKDPILSFVREYEDAGIYYYLKDSCTGISSGLQNTSGDITFGDYALDQNRVFSARLVVGSSPQSNYAALLYKDYNQSGKCSDVFFRTSCLRFITQAENINPPPHSPGATDFTNPYSTRLFHWRQPASLDADTAQGIGIWLYTAEKALFISAKSIDYNFTYNGSADDLIKNGDASRAISPGNNIGDGERCTTGETCLKEIDTNNGGNYTVVIYAKNVTTGEDTCYSFNTNQSFQDGTGILSHGKKIYKITIFPSFPS